MSAEQAKLKSSRVLRRVRWIRRATMIVFMLPVFQGLGACGTGINQVLGSVTNSFPAAVYNAAQSTFLLPYRIGVLLATGGLSGSNSLGGGGGLGGTGGTGGTGGFGGTGGTGGTGGFGGTGGGI